MLWQRGEVLKLRQFFLDQESRGYLFADSPFLPAQAEVQGRQIRHRQGGY
jgi:hypothetical protein